MFSSPDLTLRGSNARDIEHIVEEHVLQIAARTFSKCRKQFRAWRIHCRIIREAIVRIRQCQTIDEAMQNSDLKFCIQHHRAEITQGLQMCAAEVFLYFSVPLSPQFAQ